MTRPAKKRTSDLYHGAAGPGGDEHAPRRSGRQEHEARRQSVGQDRSPGFSAHQALAAYLAVVVLLVVVGTILAGIHPGGLGVAGIAIVQIAVIGGVPVALALGLHRRGFARALGIRAAPARVYLGALLCGASFWYLNLLLVAPLGQELFGGEEELHTLREALASTPLSLALLAAALLPAVCEELLMRGLVLPALTPRLGGAGAVILSAVLFSALHISPARLLPTLAFGLLLGYIALRARCVTPGMVVHLINNAIAVILTLGYLQGPYNAIADRPAVTGSVALLVCGAGLALVASRTTRPGTHRLS